MSVWYKINALIIGANEDIAKFLNIPKESVNVGFFEFSYGNKNTSGIQEEKLLKQNPNLIFLFKLFVEISAPRIWISRFDKSSNIIQTIDLENPDYSEINKRVLEEYTKEFPTLPEKHFLNIKGYEEFRWSMFLNDYTKVSAMLNDYLNYQKMITIFKPEDELFDED